MKKFKTVLAVAAAVAAASPTAAVAENINLGNATYSFNRDEDRTVAPGVRYTYFHSDKGHHVFVTEVDLTNPKVKIEYLTANNTMGGSTKSLANIASANSTEGHKVVAGANANFWITSEQPWKSQLSLMPHGTAVSKGTYYSLNPRDGDNAHMGGPTTTGVIGIGTDGRAYIRRYFFHNCVYNPRMNHYLDIRDINRVVTEGSADIYTPGYGRDKAFKPVNKTASNTWEIAPGTCTEVLCTLVPGEELRGGGDTKYVVKEIRRNAGTGTLGNYDLAIVGRDINGAPYAQVLNQYQVGDEVTLQQHFVSPDYAVTDWVASASQPSIMPSLVDATSGNCVTMEKGTVLTSIINGQSGYNGNNYARTLYGTNNDGSKMWIAVCGSKSGYYTGLNTTQMTYMLKYLGATYASQVDCGGSSQMYVDGRQVNYSTDSGNVRAVHSGMFVVSLDDSGTVKPDPDPEPEPETTTDRYHHAYGLKTPVINTGEKTISLTFSLTGDVANAILHFDYSAAGVAARAAGTATQSWEAGPLSKGLNTVTIPAEWFELATHDWSVEVVNYPAKTNVRLVETVGGARAAVACFTDPEFPEVYGYAAVGRATNTGIDIYSPEGVKVSGALHANNAVFGGAGATNPSEATTRGTEVYFASWNDKAYGVAAFDITTPTVAPYSVFEGTKASSGLITYNNSVQVGSGTPGIAIWGEGAQTSIVVFDEDIFSNMLARNIIGTAKTTHNQLQLVGHGFKAGLANHAVSIAATANGVFVTQQRANGMENGAKEPDGNVAGLRYISMPDGQSMWYSGQEVGTDLVPSANGGVDVNRAGDRLALSTYKGVNLYSIEWNGNTPKLTLLEELPNPDGFTATDTKNRTVVKFDAAGNIHAVSVLQGYYILTPKNLKGASATAKAPAAYAFTVDTSTGVGDVAVDSADDVAPVYYDLRGVRVEAERLAPGIYVKVTGKKVEKVRIR